MVRPLLDELAHRCRGHLLRDEPLWRHTSWQVGGPAAALLRPANHVDLVKAVRLLDAASCPWLVLGGGSNLLVRDGGFPGVRPNVKNKYLTLLLPQKDYPASVTSFVRQRSHHTLFFR